MSLQWALIQCSEFADSALAPNKRERDVDSVYRSRSLLLAYHVCTYAPLLLILKRSVKMMDRYLF